MFHDCLKLMIFPAARCDLHQLMTATSRGLASELKSGFRLGDTVKKRDNVDVAGSSSDLDQTEMEPLTHHLKLFPLEESINILRRCFGCLSQGLAYLHASDIRHKDIKPDNLLVDGSGSVLLADFGILTKFSDPVLGKTGSGIPLKTTGSTTTSERTEDQRPLGRTSISHVTNDPWELTRKYAWVEMMKGRRNPRPYASDIFSLGCVFLEIATLMLGWDPRTLAAFQQSHHQRHKLDPSDFGNLEVVYTWIQKLELDNQDIKAHGRETTPTPQTTMTDALPIIRRMLDENPTNRPPAHGLWQHFKRVSLEICADCDPRHPNVWRSHDMVDLEVTTR